MECSAHPIEHGIGLNVMIQSGKQGSIVQTHNLLVNGICMIIEL